MTTLRNFILISMLMAAWADNVAYAESAKLPCDSPLALPDCLPTQDCTVMQDFRECRVCVVKNPFNGGCIQWSHDPTCEVVKAAQNNAAAESKISCEANKAAQKAQCEAARSSIAALNAQRTAGCKTGEPRGNVP